MRKRYHYRWWTRERVIEALRLFYRTYREAVTSHDDWQATTKGQTHNVRARPFPSVPTLMQYFPDMYAAWEAAGVTIPARKFWNKEWTELEDWYLVEACGLLSRKQIARDLNRTPDAVHRRLYDLGLNTRTHRGWTANRLAKATGVPVGQVISYSKRGLLPCRRGNHFVYYDPADFLVIKEIDWGSVPEELAAAVRRSLHLRMVNAVRRLANRTEPHGEIKPL